MKAEDLVLALGTEFHTELGFLRDYKFGAGRSGGGKKEAASNHTH